MSRRRWFSSSSWFWIISGSNSPIRSKTQRGQQPGQTVSTSAAVVSVWKRCPPPIPNGLEVAALAARAARVRPTFTMRPPTFQAPLASRARRQAET